MYQSKGLKGEVGTWGERSQKDLDEYFEDPYNIDTQEEVVVYMCGFDGIRRGKYIGGEEIGRAEFEVRVGKLKNGKAAGKYEITGEIIKGGGNDGEVVEGEHDIQRNKTGVI